MASLADPVGYTSIAAFRAQVLALALGYEYEGGAVAGVLFASRWGGGGVVLT